MFDIYTQLYVYRTFALSNMYQHLIIRMVFIYNVLKMGWSVSYDENTFIFQKPYDEIYTPLDSIIQRKEFLYNFISEGCTFM